MPAVTISAGRRVGATVRTGLATPDDKQAMDCVYTRVTMLNRQSGSKRVRE